MAAAGSILCLALQGKRDVVVWLIEEAGERFPTLTDTRDLFQNSASTGPISCVETMTRRFFVTLSGPPTSSSSWACTLTGTVP